MGNTKQSARKVNTYNADIVQFVKHLNEKNYAEANKYLQDVVNLKIAQQIRNNNTQI